MQLGRFDPAKGNGQLLEDCPHFFKCLVQRNGCCNRDECPYHNLFISLATRPLLLGQHEEQAYAALCQAAGKEIVEHNAPAAGQFFQLR